MELLLIILFGLMVNGRLSTFIDYFLESVQIDLPERLLTKSVWMIFYVIILLIIAGKFVITTYRKKKNLFSEMKNEVTSFWLRNKVLLILGVVIGLSAIISAIWSLDKTYAITGVLYYSLLFSVLLIVKSFWSKKLAKYFYFSQIIIAVILFTVAILQIIGFQTNGLADPLIMFFDRYGGFVAVSYFTNFSDTIESLRPASLMVDPNFTAVFGITQILFGFRYFISHIKNKRNSLNYLLFDTILIVCAMGYVLFTSSRTSFVMGATAITISLLSILIFKKLKKKKKSAKKIALGSFIAFDYLQSLYERLINTFSSSDQSTQDHLSLAKVAFHAFLSSPIVGVGIGCYTTYYSANVEYLEGITNAHSAYLRVLAELGIIGAISWGSFIIYLLKIIINKRSVFYIGFFIGILVANITYDFFMTPWLWFYFGLMLGELST